MSGNIVADAVVIRQGMLRDAEDVESKIVGFWRESTNFDTFVGKHYLVKEKDENRPGWEDSSVTYILQVPEDGMYALFVSGVESEGRATAMPLTVTHVDGITTVPINQKAAGNALSFAGSFRFSPEVGEVSIGVVGTEGQYVIADFVWVTKHQEVDTEHTKDVEIQGVWRKSTSRSGYLGGHYLVEESDAQNSSITCVLHAAPPPAGRAGGRDRMSICLFLF